MINELILEFLASLAADRGLATATVDAYRRDLSRYEIFLDGRAPDPSLISEFVAGETARGLAPSTIARRIAAVRGLHRFAVAEGLAESDPARLVESPRRPRPLPKALTIEQITRLLDAPNETTPLGRRDRALLEVAYATGARVTELVGLDDEDLDLDAGLVLLSGKGGKQRINPVGRHAITAVRRYLPDRAAVRRPGLAGAALFLNARGGRLTRQGVWGIVRKHALRAGLAGEKVSPHVLRHSAATHMVEGGADLRSVQELLGHATISTTQVYTRVSPQHLLEVFATSHPRS